MSSNNYSNVVTNTGLSRFDNTIQGLLIDGDSLAAHNNNEIAPITYASQSNGIASVVVSLLPIPGCRIKIGNYSDPKWNGVFNVLSSSNGTITFKIDPEATLIPKTIRSAAVASLMEQRTASGDYVWAELLNGVNYSLKDNVALGGRTITEVLEDAHNTIGKYNNCLIDLSCGTNDVIRSVSTSVSEGALEKYILYARTLGHIVLLNTVPPLFGAANTATVQQLTLALNASIKKLAIKYSLPLYDKYAALVDPATAAALVTNIDTSDNIHLTPSACKINATNKAAIYDLFVPKTRIDLPATNQDARAIISTSTNLMDSGFFAGTSGTGGAGVIATGWTLAPTTITVTGSKGVGAVGDTQILTLSGSSGSFTFQHQNTIAPQMQAGKSYEFIGKMSWANFAAGLRVTVGIIGNIGELRAVATRNATALLPLSGSMVFRSEPFTVPVSPLPITFVPRLTAVTTAAPGGTETITLENWAVREV